MKYVKGSRVSHKIYDNAGIIVDPDAKKTLTMSAKGRWVGVIWDHAPGMIRPVRVTDLNLT